MVNITARETGRDLELLLGEEPPPGSVDDRVRIVVRPLSAKLGAALFASYNDILFARAPTDVTAIAENATRVALGAWHQDGETPEEAAARDAQWDAVQDLRWDEGEVVCQAALYWNMQGGGIDAVRALLAGPEAGVNEQGEALGGPQAAQRMILQRAGLWTAYSRLMTLLSSGAVDEIPEPDGSSATSTPPGTSPNASAPVSGV